MPDRTHDVHPRPEDLNRHDYEQAIEGIRRGLESMAHGEGRPAEDVFKEIRTKLRIPRAK